MRIGRLSAWASRWPARSAMTRNTTSRMTVLLLFSSIFEPSGRSWVCRRLRGSALGDTTAAGRGRRTGVGWALPLARVPMDLTPRFAGHWDQRYREGNDPWDLGRSAPPLEAFLRADAPGWAPAACRGCCSTPASARSIPTGERLTWRLWCACWPRGLVALALLMPSTSGGPPWGSDPELFGQQVAAAGLQQRFWEPARGSVPERDNALKGIW